MAWSLSTCCAYHPTKEQVVRTTVSTPLGNVTPTCIRQKWLRAISRKGPMRHVGVSPVKGGRSNRVSLAFGMLGPWYLQLQWPHANAARKPRREAEQGLEHRSRHHFRCKRQSSFCPQTQPCVPKTMGRLFPLRSVYMQAVEAAKA